MKKVTALHGTNLRVILDQAWSGLSPEARLLWLAWAVSGQKSLNREQLAELANPLLEGVDEEGPCSWELALGELVLLGYVRETAEGVFVIATNRREVKCH